MWFRIDRKLASCFVFLFAMFALVSPATAAQQRVKTFDIAIRDGTVAPEFKTLRVKEGDHVVIRWSSNASVVVHLEGYQISIKAGPRQTGAIEFDASITGRFPIHAHPSNGHDKSTGHGKRHGALAHLEVYPQ